MKIIAALFVEKDGPYFNIPGVVPWDIDCDARKYCGPDPVVAHPPCERWGRYWSGGPSAKIRRKLGDDGGCFKAALHAVNTYGGVLEHPEATHAWKHFGIIRPNPKGGWTSWGWYWVCQVEQGHYGHPARKKTWLYYVGRKPPPDLIWGPALGCQRLDEGFHSAEERRTARANGQRPIKRLTRKQNLYTPKPFRDLLISLARG